MKGISKSTMQRYLVMRENVDAQLDEIRAVSRMLSYYKGGCCDDVAVDLHSLGHIHEAIHRQALDIAEQLEDFVSVLDAKIATGELTIRRP